MRSILFYLAICCSLSSSAQWLDHLVIQLGPKMEFYQNRSEQVQLLSHLDAGFSIYACKNINEQWEAKVGLIKRDFTAKFSLEIFDPNTNQVEQYFVKTAYPSYSSYLIHLGAQRKEYFQQNTKWFVGGALMFYAQRKLNRRGLESQTEYLLDSDQNPVSSMEMRSFANGFDEGNYIFRIEGGFIHAVNSYLALETGVYVSASSLSQQSFELEFVNDQGTVVVRDKVWTQGLGLGLNVGVRIRLPSSEL